jgi:hypothetical protein
VHVSVLGAAHLPNLRKQLVQSLLAAIPGLEERASKVAGGSALFYRDKEIAHFHGDNELDARLTRKLIKSEGLTHPPDSTVHPNRAASSEWIELQFLNATDVSEIVRLFKLVCGN